MWDACCTCGRITNVHQIEATSPDNEATVSDPLCLLCRQPYRQSLRDSGFTNIHTALTWA